MTLQLAPVFLSDLLPDKKIERKRKMVIKSEYSQNKLLFVVEAMRILFADENFVNLLRAEGLDTLPTPLAERIHLQQGAT